ncbi:MAG: heavy-metal-associated domain-containing protein [Croceibacterium sp.]
MTALKLPSTLHARRLLAVVFGGVALAVGVALIAQVSGDRGIAPVAATTDISVGGIEVNVVGKSPEDAREQGWKQAEVLAWKKIGGPDLPPGQIESMVSAVVIQSERVGPRRYVATLGVVFDRKRAGALLGAEGEKARSAPMLTLPVLISGGTETMYEVRNPWQQAWAEFQAGASEIDYVRPVGAGGDSLLLTYGQVGRRSRAWWNNILDSYGAADIIVPVARLERQWPGGPVKGTFTARYGPDNTYLDEFSMTAPNEAAVPQMLAQAVVRFDQLFAQALDAGKLRPDPTLGRQNIQVSPAVQALLDAQRQQEAAAAAAGEAQTQITAPGAAAPTPAPTAEAQVVSSFTVQFATPNAAAVDSGLAAVRGAAGVRGAATSSIAIGGMSVMRVTFAGDAAALAAALRARGFQVNNVAGILVIRR